MGRGISKRAIAAALVVAGVLVFPGVASAATITPTVTFDQLDGAAPCSLREAVRSANANSDQGGCTHSGAYGADLIVLAGDDYELSLPSTDEDASADGDLDVTESLTIQGVGADATGIDGNSSVTSDRVFYLTAGTLTLSGLRVHDGAFLLNESAGGGVFAKSGTTLNLVNAAVSNNRSPDGGGGGISSEGAVNLNGSTVSGNQSTSEGSGIFSANGSVTLVDSTVNDNSVTDGITAINSTTTLVNSIVAGNSGRGIDSNSPVTLTKSAVRRNGNGGVIGSIVTFVDSTVTENSGTSAITGNVNFSLTNSIVSDNRASGPGGGLYGSGTIINSTVVRNAAGTDGGGIWTGAGDLTIAGSTIAGNDTGPDGRGGGIYFLSSGTLNLSNSTLSGNQARGSGGGIEADVGTSNLANVTISGNVADSDSTGPGAAGGGIARYSGTVNLRNSIVAGNLDHGAFSSPDCFGGVNSQGYNLFGQLTADCPISGVLTGNQTAAPQLSFLARNGGPTLTEALAPASPAVDSAYPGSGPGQPCEATDQRGVPRALGGRCDKGAYERVLCRGQLVNVVGTNGADSLAGTSGNDGILGLNGADRLSGGSGNDGLCGGAGDDRLAGGSGKDFLDGGVGSDRCAGGSGSDRAVACERKSSVP
ncbi:MAG: hypothetical protein QOJ38_2023 [Solirubrobacterales bacterium]|nr:hypothetical protein [Solirubrobacterales bacterium]